MSAIKLLISHYTEEKGLAEAWAELLADVSNGAVECWYSSAVTPKGGMDIGHEWREQIYSKIAESDAVIAIQSPTSNGRPWVIWECGLASGVNKERGVIPIVYSMEKPELASPLTSYQVYVGDNKDSVKEVCDRLMALASMELRTQTFEVFYPKYASSVSLHKPRRSVPREAFEVWRDRFDTLIESGRVSELAAKRHEMYASLPKPFKPVFAHVHELLSRILTDQKDFPSALEESDYGLAIIPDDIELLHRKALCLIEIGDPAGSLDTINKLFNTNSELRKNPELSTLEGRIYREKWVASNDPNHLRLAREAYSRAANSYPNQYYPCVNAGELALLAGDEADAKALFTKAIAICKILRDARKPNYWIEFTEGQSLIGLGEIKDALRFYRSGVKLDPPPRVKATALNGAFRTCRAKGIDQEELSALAVLLS